MDQKAGYQFTIRELSVTYDSSTKLFTCDQEQLISLLYSYYPLIYENLLAAHPEIQLIPIKNTLPNQLDLNQISPLKTDQTEPEEPKLMKKEVPKPKVGVMLKIKKGIKSLIYKITPKKLRKRFNMSDI